MEQRTNEWYKARLGKITGSQVWCLMATPRTKGETFTDTAKGYLYELAAERRLNPVYLDCKFDEWLQRTNIETWAMRYGSELEEEARQMYIMNTDEHEHVEECGFNVHPDLPNYGDSPDGLIWRDGKVVATLEIKCPNPATWMKYYASFKSGKTLKEIEPKYYWQCQSHMLCAGVDRCDFVSYDKMLQGGLQVVRIDRSEEDTALMAERIRLADDFINTLVS